MINSNGIPNINYEKVLEYSVSFPNISRPSLESTSESLSSTSNSSSLFASHGSFSSNSSNSSSPFSNPGEVWDELKSESVMIQVSVIDWTVLENKKY